MNLFMNEFLEEETITQNICIKIRLNNKFMSWDLPELKDKFEKLFNEIMNK